MKQSDILVIIPAYNEEETIQRVVDNLIENYPQYDYVVINDCSKDGTREILRQNGYNYLDLPINLGIGGGVQSGYKYALEGGYRIAIQMDGDGQHDPASFQTGIELIRNGEADVVVGSRFINKEGFQSNAMRRLGISFLSALIRLVCGCRVKDVTSGYRIVNEKFIRIYAAEYTQDYPEPEAILTARMHRGVVTEIPVVMNERTGGTSSINVVKSVYYMIKVSIAILLFKVTFNGREPA